MMQQDLLMRFAPRPQLNYLRRNEISLSWRRLSRLIVVGVQVRRDGHEPVARSNEGMFIL